MSLRRSRIVLACLGALLACAAPAGAQDPGTGPGGPVLVVAGPDDTFSHYYAEILRAEGLNAFDVTEGDVSAATLAGHRVVVLGRRAVSAAEVAALTTWVQGGGNLIAMRPPAALAPLLGLGGSGTDTVEQGYLDVDAAHGPGKGITDVPMQFHGVADEWIVAAPVRTVATLLTSAGSATGSPAVTLRSVGTRGGQAAAFTYDLAASVVGTRQGNEARIGVEGDGEASGLRSGDLFAGGWLDFDKVRIPQADEQQRLLANLVTEMARDVLPMPRFWYLPRGERAAVVMTGDDHDKGGTVQQFAAFDAARPQTCSVAQWECVRATSYLWKGSPLTPAQKTALVQDGFELSIHPNADCTTYTPAVMAGRITGQLNELEGRIGAIDARTMRTHCVSWGGWVDTPLAEAQSGIRLDTNYYWWPGAWARERPGMFTGSGFPMRFADTNGDIVDVYQATTQVTDELEALPSTFSWVRPHIVALLDGALNDGYYGAFTMNMHTDEPAHAGATAIVQEATSRDVPIISAAQLLDWTDGRNASTFTGLSYASGALRFGVVKGAGATGLRGMIPAADATGALRSLTRDGAPVAVETRTVKGIAYAMFDAQPGAYVATYPATAGGGPGTPPSGPSGNPPAAPGDTVQPYLTLRKRFVRASRKGRVVFVATCPKGEQRCVVDFRIERKGKRLARKRLTVAGGATREVKLTLSRAARKQLKRKSPLVARAVIRIVDAAGNRAMQRIPVTLYAPRKR